jgi:phosphoglycolate phosphatase
LLLIFDLDGTLIDSKKDLTISTNAVRQHFGMEPLDEATVGSYVGNGAAALVRRAMGPNAPDALVDDALQYFLKFYRAHALEHTHLYRGVREAVTELSAQGHTLGVLTNKPGRISVDIVAALGLGNIFSRVYGGDMLPAKKPDPGGIVALMQESGANASETVMIGDSSVDVQTARNAGVSSCGVLWGFQPESFRIWPPDVYVDDPRELPGAISELAKNVESRHGTV